MTLENKHVEDLTVVVTGASSGIGLAAAEELARRGAHVTLVGRDPGRLAQAVDRVRAAGGRSPNSYQADFARLDDVRRLADSLGSAHEHIDVLANNAGLLVPRLTTTVDGYEMTVQTNHLAPFLLTNLLRDRLRGGRVVNTASDAHRSGAGIDPENLTGKGGRYSTWAAYGASKMANILFTVEAARRWPDVLSTSFHPGVVRTNFGSGTIASTFFKLAPFLNTPAKGADTLVWLATTAASELTSGGYYQRRAPARPTSRAGDPDLAARLWKVSAEACGL